MNKDEFNNISYWSPVKISRENILKGMLAASVKYAKGKLIDVGCGMKPYENIFKPYVSSYFGIDYPVTAEANYGSKTKADLYVDCTDTGLESESFDTLLSTQVMEHVFNTKKYISECHRVLKKEGIAIFTIPLLWQCHAAPHDYYRFTKYAIKDLFENQGFKILELKPLEGACSSLIQVFICCFFNYCTNSILFRFFRKLTFVFMLPILNCLAFFLDKIFWYDKLCLDYILIVKK